MKQTLLFTMILVWITGLMAQDPKILIAPPMIDFQGRLADPEGNPVNANLDITFSLYESATGGTAFWSETQTVQVTDGLFQVTLGSVVQLSADLFEDADRWLGIQVGTEAEMSPRTKFSSVGFALLAERVNLVTHASLSGTGSSLQPLQIAQQGASAGQVLKWDGASWSPGNDGLSLPFSNQTAAENFGLSVTHEKTSGVAWGLHGKSLSTEGIGVIGESSAPTGLSYGVFGRAESPDGYGVYGISEAASGYSIGVRGQTYSTEGRGVFGMASANTGVTYGVRGRSNSTIGIGVSGLAGAESGLNYGVQGVSVSNEGVGVWGFASASTGSTFGVIGQSASDYLGTGVKGIGFTGIYGETNHLDGYAVFAKCSASTGQARAISASVESPTAYSGYFWGGRFYIGGGNVGIGVSNPLATFCVNSNSSSTFGRFYSSQTGQGVEDGLLIAVTGTTGWLYNYENAPLFFGTNNTMGMTMDENQRVGIGVMSPGYLLHVASNAAGSNWITGIHNTSIASDSHGLVVRADGGKPLLVQGNNGSTLLQVLQNGRVGIGTATPGSRLHVKQAGTGFLNGLRLERHDNTNWWSIQINSYNDLVFDYNGSNTRAWIEHATAEYHYVSDRSLKTDIYPIHSALSKLMQLNPVTFRFTSNPDAEDVSYGLIAQEVKEIYPEFVSENNGNLGIAYHNFSVVNIKAIQEQQEEIAFLQKQIEELVKQNKELLEEILQLKTTVNARLERLEGLSEK